MRFDLIRVVLITFAVIFVSSSFADGKRMTGGLGEPFAMDGRVIIPTWYLAMEPNGDLKLKSTKSNKRLMPIETRNSIYQYPDSRYWISVLEKAIEWRSVAENNKANTKKEIGPVYDSTKYMFISENNAEDIYLTVELSGWSTEQMKMKISSEEFAELSNNLKKGFESAKVYNKETKKTDELFK